MTKNVLGTGRVVKLFGFVLKNMDVYGKARQDEAFGLERQEAKRKIGRKTGGLRWKSRKGEILCST